MNANSPVSRKTRERHNSPCLLGIALALALIASAGGQQATSPSAQRNAIRVTSSAPPQSTPVPSPAPTTGQSEEKPYAPAGASPSQSPTPSPGISPARTGLGFVLPQLNGREIVVTAVGDVMLGSTYPDETGGLLPPNDGADLLAEVTPLLKRGDIVFGNLEGPLYDGDEPSAKCRGKAPGPC